MVSEILISWNLEELVEVFQEHEIVNIDDLMNLKDCHIRELIPKIGKRIKFSQKLEEYKTIFFASSSSTISVSEDESVDEPNNVENLKKQYMIANKSFCGKHAMENTLNPVGTLNLKNILSGNSKGKLVLQTYEKNHVLNSKSRSILVDLIITHTFTDVNGRLTNADFEVLASKINEIFPNEPKQLYYIPPLSKFESKYGKSGIARGKLVDKYRNRCRELRSAGIKLFNADQDTSTENENIGKNEKSVIWLKSRTEPWEEVLSHWRNTFFDREVDVKKAKAISEFFSLWPTLKLPQGHTLIDIDFELMFSDKSLALLKDWYPFFDKIAELRTDSVRDTIGLELLSHLQEENLSENSKVSIQITLLSYLVPPRGRSRTGTKHWKPSIIECQEGIILHAKSTENIEEVIQKKRLQKIEQGLNVQPYLLIVGNTVTEINSSYIVLDTVKYKFENVLKAFDIVFKSYHALGIEYSSECRHIFMLMQLGLYKFNTKWDNHIPYIMDLVEYLCRNEN